MDSALYLLEKERNNLIRDEEKVKKSNWSLKYLLLINKININSKIKIFNRNIIKINIISKLLEIKK